MWSSPLFWIFVSLTVFWALGAYNRLMRLRSAVVQAFGGLDAHMQRLLALLGEAVAARGSDGAGYRPAMASAPLSEDRIAALAGAMVQFSASLAVARARPLDADALAALVAARSVVDACWAAVMDDPLCLPHNDHDASAGSRSGAIDGDAVQDGLSEPTSQPALAHLHTGAPLSIRWAENVAHANHAIETFNDAVREHNEAVAQFPASLLARIFGFHAARRL